METNPAHLPGKRRPAAAPKKAGDQAQPSAPPAPPPAAARPKRAFGTARSSNVTVPKPPQKPLPTKPGKPLTNPLRNGTKKPSNAFQEPAKEHQTDQKGMQGGGEERTPTPMTSSVTDAAAETPYQSAENCSKCRFDKLETAAYWLAQIKIAESALNHSVAAAFFRLASDCNAQPFCRLQCELKHYVARHSSVASELQWGDLCAVYGLSKDKPSVDHCDLGKLDAVRVDEVGRGAQKDECFEFDIIHGPLMDVDKETTELIAGDDVTDEFVDLKPLSSTPCQQARSTVAGAEAGLGGQILNRGKEGTKARSPKFE